MRNRLSKQQFTCLSFLAVLLITPGRVLGQTGGAIPRAYPLVSTDGLHLHNVTATSVTLAGKRGVRLYDVTLLLPA